MRFAVLFSLLSIQHLKCSIIRCFVFVWFLSQNKQWTFGHREPSKGFKEASKAGNGLGTKPEREGVLH